MRLESDVHGSFTSQSPRRRRHARSAARGGRTAQDRRQPHQISLEAASTDVDYRSNVVRFRDVSITQGDTTVQAERAEATGLDFDDSRWVFEGNVRIRVQPRGELRSMRAVVVFKDNRIEIATITGTPAEFEQRRADSDLMARGRAGAIEYEVADGTVRLSEDAWLTDGRNEITGPSLVYNIREERVQAATEPGGDSACASPSNPPSTETAEARAPRRAPMTLLRAAGLEKSYKSRQVVRDLSLEVREGEIVGLLGPNGAGKTTAFYMIVGLVPCDAGRIWLADRDLTYLPMHRRAQLGLGYLPQEASVFRKLSVENNILAILETRATSTGPSANGGSRSCWRSCASATCAGASACRSPAASDAASRSRARSPRSRSSCCSMSRSRASIRCR